MKFFTVDTERMRINSSGNVGIGTTNPDSPLEVQFVEANGTSKEMLHLDYNPTNNYGSAIFKISSGTSANNVFEIEQVTGGGNGDFGTYFRNASSGAYGNINFVTGASTSASSIVMTIGGGTQKGNVGIGTTSPSTKLHVRNGEATIASDTDGVKLSYSNGNSSGIIDTAFSDNNLEFRTNGTAKMWIANAGNVGIGTTSPNEKLQLNLNAYAPNGINAGLFASTAAGSTTIALRSSGVTHFNGGNVGIGTTSPSSAVGFDAKLQLESANPMLVYKETDQSTKWEVGAWGGNYVVYNGTNERMRITSAGWVGIGTTSPAEKLEVNGSIKSGNLKIENSNGGRIGLNRNTANGAIYNNSYGAFQIQNNGTGFFELQSYNSSGSYTGVLSMLESNGYVGIGTTSPQQKLDVNGDIAIKAATQLSFNTSNGTLSVGGDAGQLDLLSSSIFINYSGNVGIGTTSPSTKLDVDGGFKLSDYTSTSVATTGSLDPNQNYQAPTQDTLADLAVDPSGNVVRGMQEGTWTFTAAELNQSLGNTLIAAPGVNKAVVVYESSWMIKYNATGTINANQRYEIRQANHVSIGIVSVFPAVKINNILSNNQTMPGGGASAYGFYSRDVPADAGGRTFKTNTATTLHRNTADALPSGVQTISIKLRYRIYDATTF